MDTAADTVNPIAQADAIEASAYRDMAAAAPPGVARSLGLYVLEAADATLLVAPGTPMTLFNRVIGLGVFRPGTEPELDAIVAGYRRAGCKEFWIHVSPGPQSVQLQQWLGQRGLVPPARKSWVKMLRGTDSPPLISTDLEVRPVDPGESGVLGQVVCAAYGMPVALGAWFEALSLHPGWRGYVALDGVTVVAAAFLFTRGKTAWLGAAGTLAKHRQRGAQGALMARRIADAIAAGCTCIATETGEPIGDEPNPSLANMRRCGFRQVASRLNYAFREST